MVYILDCINYGFSINFFNSYEILFRYSSNIYIFFIFSLLNNLNFQFYCDFLKLFKIIESKDLFICFFFLTFNAFIFDNIEIFF